MDRCRVSSIAWPGRTAVGEALANITAPTLLIVGGRDEPVLTWNRAAQRRLAGPSRLEVVPGATHLFEEPGAMAEVMRLAGHWFADRLGGPSQP